MFRLACVKFLIILDAAKNRRVYAFCHDLSLKFFGLKVMLLPRMSTMLGSTRFLECHVGVCDVWLEFFVVCKKAFPLTYSVFLRNDILGIQLPPVNNIVETVLCQSFYEFHAIRNFLLQKFFAVFSLRMLSPSGSFLKIFFVFTSF